MVTIIVTTYNREKYLEKCLKSILSQSYKDFYILVISDGYFKDTEILVDSFNDKRVKLIFNNHTSLPAVSRNIGLSNVKTKYVCFCDDDDIWHVNKLKYQIELIELNNCDVLFTDVYKINSADELISKSQPFFIKIYNYFLMKWGFGLFFKNFICLSSTLIRTEIVKNIKFNESPQYRGTEDYLFWLELQINKYVFHFLDHKLVNYRIHENNISKNRNEAYKRTLNVLNFLKLKYPNQKLLLHMSYLFYYLKRNFI
jgi:teichuronic acid biosynthesis glycosyltransferase TuaG